jgi:hypothetical protein
MKNMTMYIIGGLLILGVAGTAIMRSRGSSSPYTAPSSVQGTSSATTAVTANDPQDIVPGTYANPIQNTATADGLTIVSGITENNVDANAKVVSDHLEIVLKNASQKPMSNVEVYYTVKDLTTSKSEGYYKKLSGFILQSGESRAVHFDGKQEADHFGVNTNGIYFTSANKLQFDVEVSTPDFKTAHLQILKDAGGAELKD